MSDASIVEVGADGLVAYRASAIGGCSKALVAARLGYTAQKPPAKVQELFDRGHEAEVTVKSLMRDEGWSLWGEQEELWLPVSNKIGVRGHIDAKGTPSRTTVLKADTPVFIVEVKSQSHSEFVKGLDWSEGLWARYAWQVSTYMLASGLPLAIVRYDRDEGDIDIAFVEKPIHGLTVIKTRVLLAESVAMLGALPESCDVGMYPCPYFRLHEEEWDGAEVDDDESLDAAAIDYASAVVAEKVAREKVKLSRGVLEKELEEREAKSLRTKSGYKVTTWTQKNPPVVDMEALGNFLKEHDKEVAEFQKQTSSSRIRVTAPKGE